MGGFPPPRRQGSGQETEKEISFLKEYTVFNAEQCQGLPQHFYALAESPKEKLERIDHAERFFANTGAKIEYSGNRAYYAIEPDYVRLPPFETFQDAEHCIAFSYVGAYTDQSKCVSTRRLFL